MLNRISRLILVYRIEKILARNNSGNREALPCDSMVIFAHRAIELSNVYYFSPNRILHHIDDASVSREQIFPVTKRFLLDVAHQQLD